MNVQNEIKEIKAKLGSINTRLTENRQLTGGFHNLLSATHQDTESASPLRGDIITGQTATPEWRRLALGTTGQILKSDGTDIGWDDFGHDILSAGHSDAGVASVSVGDLITGQAGPEWNRLAIGGSGTFLRSDGSAPSWASISSGDLPSHTHIKTDITDTPWAWTDVSKSGSVLNDIGNVNASPGDGDALVWVDASSEWQAGSGGGGAPTDASYIVVGYDTGLSAERQITEGVGIKFTDGGGNSTFTIANEFHESVGTETGNLKTTGYLKADELWFEDSTGLYYAKILSAEAQTTTRTLTINMGDADRIIDLDGSLYVQATVYLDQNLREQDSPMFDALYLRDTGSDHGLRLYLNENLTNNRNLYIYVSDADRSFYLYGNLTVNASTQLNQNLLTTSSPVFQNLHLWDSAGQDFYINFDISEALTANRTVSFYTGDAARSFQLAGNLYITGNTYADQDLRQSAEVEFAELRLGTNPATSGIMGIGNQQYIYGRNAANSSDLIMFSMSSGDLIRIGYSIYMSPSSTANVGINQSSWGTSANAVLAIHTGTAPTTSPTDAVQLWCANINGAGGRAGLYMRTENSESLIVPGILMKTDTGDPAYYFEGMICINTFDNTIKMYGDTGWRTLASGW